MKRYESYKDSGVKWLGEIPGHWEVRKIKYTFKERSQKGFPKLSLLSATQQYGVIKKDDYENRTVVATKGLDTLKLVCKNDFVISLRSFEGGIEMSHEEGIISPAYTILIPKKIEPSYFRHLGKTPVFINLLKMMVTGIREGQNIDYNKLRTNLIPIPPKSEQTAIANYLDSVTSKIDEAISQQQKMIDLLNERKQIIIQNAVTKGLDPNVKMKDSGVEWIGEIPEDWEVRRIKNSCKIINKKSTDNLPYIELDNIESKSGKLLSYSNNRPDSICNHFDKGDILFCKLRPYLAKCIITGVEGKCSSELLVLRHFLGDQKYFQYLLLSPKLIDLINESTYGAKMPRANWSYIGNCIIPIPSLEEQKSIINYLDSFTSYIDSSISQCNKMISLLQERKKIIINDAVIGKIKVV